MKNILFASDLDNTLLHSRTHRRAGDLCVERLAGAEQGFMTPLTAARLRAVQQKLRFIPVTTRSMAQYLRIVWPSGTEPEYAVTTNGAILLHRGAPDAAWQEEHAALLTAAREELARQYTLQSEKSGFIRCRIVDGAYLFVYCADGIDVATCAEDCRAGTNLTVQHAGRKIYFFPPGLDKGAALRALRRRFAPAYVYAAGDSTIDLPLLWEADRAFLPAALPCADSPHIWRHMGTGVFAEALLGALQKEMD